MAKWKELGEVPDSDDESTWDSQESRPNLPSSSPASVQANKAETSAREIDGASGTVDGENQAIWDVPFSSPPDGEEQDALSTPKPSDPEPPPTTLKALVNGALPESRPPLSSLLELGHSIEINLPVGTIIGHHRAGSEESTLSSLTDISDRSVAAPPETPQEDISPELLEQLRNEDTRLGRSLRPRKPIQEHPYLLESAQYSKTWKSHGLRPVRVLAEEEKKRREEEDSQEKEFEDDSQVTCKDTAQEESEDSQFAGHVDALPEMEDALLSDDGRPSPTPELPSTMHEETVRSSQEDDEFPDPNDIEKWKGNKTVRRDRKRRPSPKASSKQKFPRLDSSTRIASGPLVLPDIDDIFDIPVSPPQTSPGVLDITPMAVVNRLGGRFEATLTPKPSSDVSSRIHSPAPVHQHSEVIDLTTLENHDSADDSDAAGSHTSADSEPDQVRLGARRIRGVLPASWLRLDQQTSMQRRKSTIRQRSPDLSPERSLRKGVAQRRLVSPQPEHRSVLFLPSDSDDSDGDVDLAIQSHEPDIHLSDAIAPVVEDDALSIIEEDHIDHMFPRRKGTTPRSNGLGRKRKRGQQSTFEGRPKQRKRQQSITGLLSREPASTTRTRREQKSNGNTRADWPRKQRRDKAGSTPSPPPRLSILDTVESNVPDFIRIAARTASKRRDQGRSSPSKKSIMLGTRQDTIDAAGVLKRWSKGMIQPRKLVPRPVRSGGLADEIAQTTPARQTSMPLQNQASQARASIRFSQPRRMVKQATMDRFIDTTPRSQPRLDLDHTDLPIEDPIGQGYRPAQLESIGDIARRHTFDARKRVLDSLYRRSRKSMAGSQNLSLVQVISRQAPEHEPPSVTETPNSLENNNPSRPTRYKTKANPRKQVRPKSIDVTAPQYAHANDPLPRDHSPPTVFSRPLGVEPTGKLVGLGPYGTHYTQHFEIFPLDRGVFFHETTMLGSGRLKSALDGKFLGNLSAHRGRCTFTIDEQTLHWGPWDAQVSSEIGIAFDWVADQLYSPSLDAEPRNTTPVRVLDFVLSYLQDFLSLSDSDRSEAFASRLVNVLQIIEGRLKETPSDTRCTEQTFIEVLTRVLVITVQALRLCQKLNTVSETFQIEELLKRLAKTTAGVLLRTDLKEVREIYSQLQHASFRERGIRNDEHVIICWVTLVRVLEEARIPRAGFLQVISSTILSSSTDSTLDADVLERAWRNMFTLLPLGEFDNTGVLISGMRHKTPLEGWAIPQHLVRRVFEVYQSGSRQSAGFNDYFRAVASRCHYLVEQWGWCKCNTMLGTIFDFFAAQDLHNLRNEEVYQSPQFLDELSGSPSLALTLEDRCFHIYLKLIALSIKRLQKIGMVKEIKNLVTRLLPNHSRQHDKVMETHEAEIAALRNHHDLLCTLFWAAPADMRPSIQSIEGLVVLSNSHKEACLISLRTWSRLSRFVVSSCSDISAYKPLADWQRNISQQVLEQYLYVEAEVNQQLLGMSAEACRNITQHFKNAVINKNKRVAMDLLHFSTKAFLDVMRCAQSLGAALFILNHYPLEQILIRLSFSSEDSGWDVLQVILNILDCFITRIDEFTTTEPPDTGRSWHEEEAIMLLERKIASPFISVVRSAINICCPDAHTDQMSNRNLCVEQAVALAGRLGACLIHAQLARPGHFFQAGKYSLFQDLSKPTPSPGRKYIPLFLAAIADRGISDFKDLGLAPLDLFFAEITKPLEYLAYENRLATSFRGIGGVYLEGAVIEIGNAPDYTSNRDLFRSIIVSMRKALVRADAGQKPHLQATFSKALRFAMDRMKSDLKSMALNSHEHLKYVEFVQSMISLIRSQDLCPVDSFFYQISPEYSPSSQDPRLQTAGILSWGLKLEEGDSKAASGLFYLLFPSFKIALSNGELRNEATILNESMAHAHVFQFMLCTMIPAILKTVAQAPHGQVLLNTYIEAVDARLASACVHQQFDEDVMIGVLGLHDIILASVGSLQTRGSCELQNGDILLLAALMQILNLLSPSVAAFLINQPDTLVANDFARIMERLTDFTSAADTYISNLMGRADGADTMTIAFGCLFDGLGTSRHEPALQEHEHITRFSSHMIQDVRNNWVLEGDYITVKGPSRPPRPSATQSGRGTRLPTWERRGVLQHLWEQVRIWNYSHDMITRKASREALAIEFLL
ncbi:Mus7/MMS22 family-domain-containing protein [Nemania sp. FL0916]|nr:Mus7/MMS22 family-domain-containing protein [Nemania sp. FL0916]